jgi:ubiquinone/menaquinone biosynthesis C-methylase UbiE
MVSVSNKTAYVTKYDRHLEELGEANAAKYHVGGIDSYYLIGAVERRLLEMTGLKPESYIIDIGCGSGRLAQALSGKQNLGFLGIDVVPRLIEYCRRELRPDWRFEVSENFTIPERNDAADFVTAFSIFTHLLHEETFAYMREAYRVLKPGGMLVSSFLEYRIEAHQKIFLSAEKSKHTERPLIVFNDRGSFEFFASEIGFVTTEFIDGSDPFVTFESPETLVDGKVITGKKPFGQSLCLMRKPEAARGRQSTAQS